MAAAIASYVLVSEVLGVIALIAALLSLPRTPPGLGPGTGSSGEGGGG